MNGYGRCEDVISLVVNPTSFLPELPMDKVRYLKLEAQSMKEEYKRDIVINYIAGNFSSNKHLCSTVLSGKDDTSIIEILDQIVELIDMELDARKKNGMPLY